MERCAWATNSNQLMQEYHDHEWGIWPDNDQQLFEMLSLETYQAGLNWQIILNKRVAFRQQFKNYELKWVAQQDSKFIEQALTNEQIVRHRGKINATINNAKCILAVQKQYGSFAEFLKINVSANSQLDLTQVSLTLAKILKKRGFKFMGPVTTEAFILAVGLINGHEKQCFKHPN